jgi:heme-degrading monooxygenase HmoA
MFIFGSVEWRWIPAMVLFGKASGNMNDETSVYKEQITSDECPKIQKQLICILGAIHLVSIKSFLYYSNIVRTIRTMAVTELACLRLGSDQALLPELLAKLARARSVMEEASGFKFHYYHCVESPELIYIIGAWPSVEFHMQDFIPSQANQDLLALLKAEVVVEWMFHLNIDQTKRQLPLDREIVAIGRHFIKDNEENHFQKTFEENKHYLESFIGSEELVVGGYRLDEGFDPSLEGDRREEFVLFTGWHDVDQHGNFAKTDGFEKYAQIRDHLAGADIKHAVRLNDHQKA